MKDFKGIVVKWISCPFCLYQEATVVSQHQNGSLK